LRRRKPENPSSSADLSTALDAGAADCRGEREVAAGARVWLEMGKAKSKGPKFAAVKKIITKKTINK
jgi:hypothetical protein